MISVLFMFLWYNYHKNRGQQVWGQDLTLGINVKGDILWKQSRIEEKN